MIDVHGGTVISDIESFTTQGDTLVIKKDSIWQIITLEGDRVF